MVRGCGSARVCLGVLYCFCVCPRCHTFGLWECPCFPFLLSSQTRNTSFLAAWACACRTTSGLAQLIPEFSENSRARVPADHWLVSFLWHPNFRLALVAHEATVPNVLVVLCSNCLCCENTQRCSNNVFVALCCSSKPNAWSKSGIEFAALSLFISDFRIDCRSKWSKLTGVVLVMSSLKWCFAALSN